MVLLSLSFGSVRRDENDEFCERKLASSRLVGVALVDVLEFSLWESFGLSATMGVIDMSGVLVRVGEVKLRLCSFFDSDSSPPEVEVWSFIFDFLILLSFFLISLSIPSLVKSNGFIVTLMGDIFSEGVVVTLRCLSFSCLGVFSSLGLAGGELGVEPGLWGSVMMAPSLL